MNKAQKRFITRKNRVRSKIAKISNRVRLSVFRSNRHIYVQVIDDTIASTLVSASTLDKELRICNKSNCNIESAKKVGELLAQRAKERGIEKVVFDKGGYKYHGVVKALADATRAVLQF